MPDPWNRWVGVMTFVILVVTVVSALAVSCRPAGNRLVPPVIAPTTVEPDGGEPPGTQWLIRTIDAHPGPPVPNEALATSVAFSPDGKLLASGGFDKTVKLWDVVTGNEVATLAGHIDAVSAVAFAPGGGDLASASYDGTVRLWDAAAREHKATIQTGHRGKILSLAYSPNGSILATGGEDSTVRLFDPATYAPIRTMNLAGELTYSLAFSSDGTLLAGGGGNGNAHPVHLWQVATGRELRTLDGHEEWVSGIAFFAENEMLATSGHDRRIRIWRIADGSQLGLITDIGTGLDCLAPVPSQEKVAVCEGDTLSLFDFSSGTRSGQMSGLTASIVAIAFAPDGTKIAVANSDGKVSLGATGR